MESLKQNKKSLIWLAIALAVGLAYFYFNQAEEPLVVSDQSTEAELVGQDLIAELTRLETLASLNTGLFTEPFFTSLRDISVPVEPVPVGRNNPFLDAGF